MLELRRVAGWPERLIAVAERHRANAFQWGLYDCATFFGDAVDEIAGFDPFAAYKPWASERGAAAVLARSGYRDMEHFVRCLFPEIRPTMARRGDIGFTAVRHRLSCPAVVMGSDAMTRDEKGWIVFSAPLLTSAFKVG